MARMGYMMAWWLFPCVASNGEIGDEPLVFPGNVWLTAAAFAAATKNCTRTRRRHRCSKRCTRKKVDGTVAAHNRGASTNTRRHQRRVYWNIKAVAVRTPRAANDTYK